MIEKAFFTGYRGWFDSQTIGIERLNQFAQDVGWFPIPLCLAAERFVVIGGDPSGQKLRFGLGCHK
jgi:hypothetical protein